MNAWDTEIEQKGMDQTLVDRMRQHGGLTERDVAENTGKPILTVKRLLSSLVLKNKAYQAGSTFKAN